MREESESTVRWGFGKITDYCEVRTGVIVRSVQHLADLRVVDAEQKLDLIEQEIAARVDALSDSHLALAAALMVNDVWLTLNALVTWSHDWTPYLEYYLKATCGRVVHSSAHRGYPIRYYIDNLCEDLSRFETFFNSWILAAGCVPVCQPLLDSARVDRYRAQIGGADEKAARAAYADSMVSTCVRDNLSFLYLFTEPGAHPFGPALEAAPHERALTVFRSEPPVVGTKVLLISPPELALRQSSH